MRSLARPLFILMTCGLCGAADCAQLLPKPDPQKTSINGSVQGRGFPNATAAFAQDPGPPRSLLAQLQREVKGGGPPAVVIETHVLLPPEPTERVLAIDPSAVRFWARSAEPLGILPEPAS